MSRNSWGLYADLFSGTDHHTFHDGHLHHHKPHVRGDTPGKPGAKPPRPTSLPARLMKRFSSTRPGQRLSMIFQGDEEFNPADQDFNKRSSRFSRLSGLSGFSRNSGSWRNSGMSRDSGGYRSSGLYRNRDSGGYRSSGLYRNSGYARKEWEGEDEDRAERSSMEEEEERPQLQKRTSRMSAYFPDSGGLDNWVF